MVVKLDLSVEYSGYWVILDVIFIFVIIECKSACHKKCFEKSVKLDRDLKELDVDIQDNRTLRESREPEVLFGLFPLTGDIRSEADLHLDTCENPQKVFSSGGDPTDSTEAGTDRTDVLTEKSPVSVEEMKTRRARIPLREVTSKAPDAKSSMSVQALHNIINQIEIKAFGNTYYKILLQHRQ